MLKAYQPPNRLPSSSVLLEAGASAEPAAMRCVPDILLTGQGFPVNQVFRISKQLSPEEDAAWQETRRSACDCDACAPLLVHGCCCGRVEMPGQLTREGVLLTAERDLPD